nr:NlpC/P60 family protein [Sulfitobacter aestuariivivens]
MTPDPARVTCKQDRRIALPLCDLRRRPDGPRDRQLIYGADVTLLDEADGWAYVQARSDGYVGYVTADALGAVERPTHIVTEPSTRAYAEADLKSPDRTALTHLSRVAVVSEDGDFALTALGYLPRVHLSRIGMTASDPATIAGYYLGTDYLWGGNSRWGIDCSGLVQAALTACGVPCPGDSDMQMSLGNPASAPYRRNDLLFWKGHVALVTDPETILHANAHAMAVTFEPISAAITRIEASGDGPMTAHRRLASFSG